MYGNRNESEWDCKRSIQQAKLPQGDDDVKSLAIPEDRERHLVAHGKRIANIQNISRLADGYAVYMREDVAGLDAFLLRAAPVGNGRDIQAVRKGIVFCSLRGYGANRDAQTGPAILARGEKLICDSLDSSGGDRKANAFGRYRGR